MIQIKKCFEILELLASDGNPLTVKKISERLEIPESTIYRYINTLIRLDVIKYDPTNKTYFLGMNLVRLGQIATRELDLIKITYPFMQELAQKTGDNTILTMRKGLNALVVEVVDSQRTGIKFAMNRGDLIPLHCCAITRPLMAFLPDEEIEYILRKNPPITFTKNTITEVIDIKRELKRVKRMGFSKSNQELTIGAIGLGSPIWGYNGKVVGCLGIVGPLHNFDKKTLPLLIKLLLKSVRECSLRLGGQPI